MMGGGHWAYLSGLVSLYVCLKREKPWLRSTGKFVGSSSVAKEARLPMCQLWLESRLMPFTSFGC